MVNPFKRTERNATFCTYRKEAGTMFVYFSLNYNLSRNITLGSYFPAKGIGRIVLIFFYSLGIFLSNKTRLRIQKQIIFLANIISDFTKFTHWPMNFDRLATSSRLEEAEFPSVPAVTEPMIW